MLCVIPGRHEAASPDSIFADSGCRQGMDSGLLASLGPGMTSKGAEIMSDAHEQLEQAETAKEISREDRKIALVIAILALFLSFSETLGKGAQTEAISFDVESANSWAFFQAKTVRMTTVRVAGEELKLQADSAADPAVKAAMQKQIEAWQKTAARYNSEPETGEGRKELAERAKKEQEERDLSLAKYHHYEIASAAFQIGIVLCSAAVITGIIALVWFAGLLGVLGVAVLSLGVYAPHLLPLP